QEEIEFAERVVRQLSLSLSNLRALDLVSKEAEQARAEARRVAEATKHAEGMLAELPEMVMGLAADGKLSFFNTAAKDRLRLTVEDIGRPVDAIETLTGVDKATWGKVNTCQNVLRFSAEMQVMTGARVETIPISISAGPLRDGGEQISGHLIVAGDITHVKGDVAARIRELEQKLDGVEK